MELVFFFFSLPSTSVIWEDPYLSLGRISMGVHAPTHGWLLVLIDATTTMTEQSSICLIDTWPRSTAGGYFLLLTSLS